MISRAYLISPAPTGGWLATSPDDPDLIARGASSYEALHNATQEAARLDCRRGHHLPTKAVLDDSVICLRCGVELARAQ